MQEPGPIGGSGSPPKNVIGRIVGVFGIKGEVKVEPLTSFLQRFDRGEVVFVSGMEHKVEGSRLHQGRILLKLDGINDPDQARALQWSIVESNQDSELDLEEDEFRTDELLGMSVVEDGVVLGEIDDVLALPAHDVLVVGDIMIPAVKAYVKKVDLKKRIISVKLIEGMRGDDAD